MAARDLQARGLLTGDIVVATTMSNMGLETALKRSGITMLRAGVGDRYVLELMQQRDAALGRRAVWAYSLSAPCYNRRWVADGACSTRPDFARTGKTIEELTAGSEGLSADDCQCEGARKKKPLEEIPAVAERIRAAEAELADSGRVVIRYSGTEALARVMVEAGER